MVHMEYKKIFVDGIMHLGDMIMTASVFPILKKAYPNAEITYLALANLAFVAELLEGVDRVIPYAYQSKGGYLDVYRMGRMLAKENFDLGISLDPRERVTLMKWFARIPVRISLEQAFGWKLGWEKWFYTQDLSFAKPWNYREHKVSESFQTLMRQYVHDEDTKFYPPSLRKSSPADMETARALLDYAPQQHKKVGFCVETTGKAKDWPPEKFAQVADWLVETYDAYIVMTGIKEHEKTVRTIISQMEHADRVVDVVGKTSFTELIALFRQIDMVLTLDTGTTHIAAASGCPVVTIFSNNTPEIYQAAGDKSRAVSARLPCSGKHICIGSKKCSKNDCVDKISVDMVKHEIKSLMETI